MKISRIELFQVDLPYAGGTYLLSGGRTYESFDSRSSGSPATTGRRDGARSHPSDPPTSRPTRSAPERASPNSPLPSSAAIRARWTASTTSWTPLVGHNHAKRRSTSRAGTSSANQWACPYPNSWAALRDPHAHDLLNLRGRPEECGTGSLNTGPGATLAIPSKSGPRQRGRPAWTPNALCLPGGQATRRILHRRRKGGIYSGNCLADAPHVPAGTRLRPRSAVCNVARNHVAQAALPVPHHRGRTCPAGRGHAGSSPMMRPTGSD